MRAKKIINSALLPLKLIIPQPVISKIPGLTTNQEIRTEEVLKYVSTDMKCLDIGCGKNMLIKRHRKRGGSGVGVDTYTWDGVDLIVQDSSKLPFEDSSFDRIMFVASLNHIPNRSEVLKETHRLLQRNGILIVTFLQPLISYIWHKVIYWDPDKRERGIKYGEIYGFTYNEFKSLLESTGFKIVKRKRFSWLLNNLCLCVKV